MFLSGGRSRRFADGTRLKGRTQAEAFGRPALTGGGKKASNSLGALVGSNPTRDVVSLRSFESKGELELDGKPRRQ